MQLSAYLLQFSSFKPLKEDIGETVTITVPEPKEALFTHARPKTVFNNNI